MVSHVSAHTMGKQTDASSMCTAEDRRNDNGEHRVYTYCHPQHCSISCPAWLVIDMSTL